MKILRPLAGIYQIATTLRNRAFEAGWFDSQNFGIPTVAVGNLSVGGTGKSPAVEWLLRAFADKQTLVVSRGYGRKSKGYLKVDPTGLAHDFGDEPLQIATKFPGADVIVSEKRSLGIAEYLKTHPAPELILLDDAFQHRSVHRDFNLMLSTYQKPFFRDLVLPAGRLRESRKGAGRASAIIFTKCPSHIDWNAYRKATERYSAAPVYFSSLEYQFEHPKEQPLILLTGLAFPGPLEKFLNTHYQLIQHFAFGDHHSFAKSEIETVIKEVQDKKACLVYSEKDQMRLRPFEHLLSTIDHKSIEVRMKFTEAEEKAFRKQVKEALGF